MSKGIFAVFEGINGCGKRTQIENFFNYFYEDRNNLFLFTREPNNLDENGRRAREMLRDESDPYANKLSAVKYFAKNRKTHNKLFIKDLDAGVHVISDRYYHSNFAFQHAQGISYEKIAKANKFMKVPDITYLLDLPASIATERLVNRDGEKRRKFDSNPDFLEEVRQNYLDLPKILPYLIGDESIAIIDGTKSIDEIFRKIKNDFKKRLSK